MHIVFDYQIFALQKVGGISRYIVELASRIPLVDAGMEATVVAPFYINEYLAETKASEVSLYGKKIASFPGKHRLLPFLNCLASRNFISVNPPDIVHETYFTPCPPVCKCPRVITVYDMIHERYPGLFTGVDQSVAAAKAKAVERADAIICISENTRDDLVACLDVDPEKITVIPLAASLSCPEKEHIQSETDKPYLLYVGLRNGVKNFDTMLKAFSSSRILPAGFDLVCVGGGSFSTMEQKRFQELGITASVRQLSVDDRQLAHLYAGATLFVYPSLYEGFGLPLLEAMRCGCPVACSSTSSMPEIAGNAALYFDPADEESIRETVESVVISEEKQQDLRQLGFIRESKFSWQSCVQQTVGLYRSLKVGN